MENVIVWAVVLAAAVWGLVRLMPRSKRSGGACSSGCGSCAFANPAGTGCKTSLVKPRRPDGRALTALVVFLGASSPLAARAADTIETWEPGAADVELYLGLDGFGTPREAQGVYGDIVIGYGVAERLSAYLGTTLQANGFLAESEPQVHLGVFATALDLAMFDVDLILDMGTGGPGMSELQIVPSTELNLDLDSPVGPWGVYLRAGLPLAGARVETSEGGEAYETRHVFELNPGVYWVLREGHQLLLEYALALHPAQPHQAGGWEHGALALGYNFAVTETLELISQATLGPLAGGGPLAAGLMVGFIATVPGAASAKRG